MKTMQHGKSGIFGIFTALCAFTAFGAATVRPTGTLVDTSSTAGQVIDQSPAYNGGNSYKAECAFDGNWASMPHCWIADLNATTTVAYLVYEFNTPTVVDGMTLRTGGEWDPVGRSPKNWTFEGSDDNTNWTVLDARSGESGWGVNQVRGYSFLNRTAYKYYKFSCTGRNSTSADGWIELYEIQFYVDSVFDLTSPATGGVVASSPAYIWDNYQYLADYAFDSVRNVNTSRWIASRADHMYFVYGFDNPTRVNGISLYMPSSGNGNNTSARAPKDWTVSGSNDGAAWTLLDTQSGETDWSEGEERYYEFANMSKYRYYKYDCTANNSANDVLQIMEIELTFHNSGLPSIGNCSVTFSDATSLSVSAEVDLNGADKLSYILNDGETVTTNAFATSVAEGQTGATTISGLSADKTYEVSILAENAAGTAVYPAGSLYTGELTLGAVVNASEDTLAPGTVAVSRASADNVPLTVYYTITGTTGSQGTTWAEPVGIVIPAGETTGYLLVTPLADLAVSENIEVAVSLAPGNYGIPASGSSATLTIENDDTPEGWTVVTLVNSFDSPAGGYMGSSYDYALTNNANLIVRFTNPESAPAGLREFALAAGNNIEANASVFPYDWMLFSSCSSSTNATGTTVDSVRYASESLSDGLTEKRSIRAYAGSWYIPADGTYSFRLHMRNCAVFSID